MMKMMMIMKKKKTELEYIFHGQVVDSGLFAGKLIISGLTLRDTVR